MVSQIIFSVRAPEKNKTTVNNQKKNPRKKKRPREQQNMFEPQALTDPPALPQQPSNEPINIKTRIMQRRPIGTSST